MLVDSQRVKIRLHGIDCPERGQDFSKVAKDYLSSMIAGKIVEVKKTDIDRYGRTVGIVTVEGQIVNEEVLKAGLAWHYKKYDTNPAWAALEEEARINKKGLWQNDNAMPPWEYRKSKKMAYSH